MSAADLITVMIASASGIYIAAHLDEYGKFECGTLPRRITDALRITR